MTHRFLFFLFATLMTSLVSLSSCVSSTTYGVANFYITNESTNYLKIDFQVGDYYYSTGKTNIDPYGNVRICTLTSGDENPAPSDCFNYIRVSLALSISNSGSVKTNIVVITTNSGDNTVSTNTNTLYYTFYYEQYPINDSYWSKVIAQWYDDQYYEAYYTMIYSNQSNQAITIVE